MPDMLMLEQKSLHWDERETLKGTFIEEGFPFEEGFPDDRADANRLSLVPPVIYTLILRDGTTLEAYVDDSQKVYAEGLQWRGFFTGMAITSAVVAAWRLSDFVKKREPTGRD